MEKVFALMVETKTNQNDDKEKRHENPIKIRKIEKLNQDNYSTWVLEMENVLDDGGLWNEATEKEKACPKEGKESWKAIMYSIEKTQFVIAEEPRCGKAAWVSLQKHHEKSGMAGRLNVLRSLLTLSWNEGTIDNHCAELITTTRKLSRMGIEFSDDITIAILLNSLPNEYQPLIMAIDVIGEEKLELKSIIAKLKTLKVLPKVRLVPYKQKQKYSTTKDIITQNEK